MAAGRWLAIGGLLRNSMNSHYYHNVTRFDKLKYLRHCTTEVSPALKSKVVTVTFMTKDGENFTVQGKEGDSLLDIHNDNNLEFDGYGCCGGTLSCSTCHVILREEDYNKIQTPMKEEELDMIDLTIGLTKTSRLGCQVIITRDLDGLVVQLPEETNNQLEK